jgi:addiction module HigA family antidote
MHPGRVLREEYMEPMQLSASELAAALDITPNRISALIAESQRHTLTSDIALRLARRFRTSPQFWLSLQNAYDLSISQAEMGAEIEARIQPLPA